MFLVNLCRSRYSWSIWSIFVDFMIFCRFLSHSNNIFFTWSILSIFIYLSNILSINRIYQKLWSIMDFRLFYYPVYFCLLVNLSLLFLQVKFSSILFKSTFQHNFLQLFLRANILACAKLKHTFVMFSFLCQMSFLSSSHSLSSRRSCAYLSFFS